MQISGLKSISAAGLVALLLAPAAWGLQPLLGIEAGETVRISQIEEARRALAKIEVEHPGNTVEVSEALILLTQRQRAAMKITSETHQLAERALKVAKAAAGQESAVYAHALAEMAKLRFAEDHTEAARPMAEEALEIARRNAQGTLILAEVADALGKICQWLEDRPCAQRAEQEAIAAVRLAPGDTRLYLASMLQQLAVLDLDLKNTAELRASVREFVELIDQQTVPDPTLASLESNAGYFLAQLGELDEARRHVRRSLELIDAMYGPDSIQAANAMLNLAEVERDSGHLEEAHKDYELGLTQERRYWGAVNTHTAGYEETDATILYELDRPKDALELALHAHRVEREYTTLAIRVLPERQALAAGILSSLSLDLALSIAAADPAQGVEAVYQEAMRSRGLVAEEMAHRQATLNRENDAETQKLIRELEHEGEEILNFNSVGGEQQEGLSEQMQALEKTERALAERSMLFRTAQRSATVNLEDIRRYLPADAALVSYFHYQRYIPNRIASLCRWEDAFAAFVVHPGREPIRIFDLGAANEVDGLVKRMRSSAESEAHSGGLGALRNERLYRAAGVTLREKIWDPLRAEIGQARLVLVVPDGQLNLVPFAGLPEGNGYLADYGPVIHLLTSERDLIPTPIRERKTGLLAIGNPKFGSPERNKLPAQLRGSEKGCRNFRFSGFGALPGSDEELSDIRSAWRQWNQTETETLFSGEQATRERFLREASQHRVLHVATHAFLLDAACGNSNPLLRSGLVFAPAGQEKEVSVVTAQQIAALDLSGVDWAVLSACNTGNGDLKDGEGVLGLERAFRVAGAHSVVMTLWPVDDQATRSFMHALYAERLGHKASTADSVWRASRAMLVSRRAAGKSTHPWYWAGFVGAGGWE